jgi:hypothetical protein
MMASVAASAAEVVVMYGTLQVMAARRRSPLAEGSIRSCSCRRWRSGLKVPGELLGREHAREYVEDTPTGCVVQRT